MSKDEEIRNKNTRRKNIIFLIQRYLQDNGMYSAAETLATEARLTDDLELCDNVDLDGIYLEYASYYHLKFGKYPKILRKAKQVNITVKPKRCVGNGNKPQAALAAQHLKETAAPAAEPVFEPNDTNTLQVVVRKIETTQSAATANEHLIRLQETDHGFGAGGDAAESLLSSNDYQLLADLIKSTILRDDSKLNWHDICGNAQAIEIIKEAVEAPLKYPQLFAQGLKPWKSLLLHGPPGSGKTLLARVLYAEMRTQVTFFNVTASAVISKWRGESEKLLKILFHYAQKHAPSIIFFDEIEGLTSRRDRPTDHESSKRFKNELLQLLDGMEQQQCAGVFILASTNLPWDIDEAFLRRFEKKMLVQLPNAVDRAKLIGKLLPLTVNVTTEKMELLVRLSENFTGDEIRLACKEIAMQSVRRVTRTAKQDGISEISVESAFHQIKPLSVKLMARHVKWQQEHGS